MPLKFLRERRAGAGPTWPMHYKSLGKIRYTGFIKKIVETCVKDFLACYTKAWKRAKFKVLITVGEEVFLILFNICSYKCKHDGVSTKYWKVSLEQPVDTSGCCCSKGRDTIQSKASTFFESLRLLCRFKPQPF